MSFAFVVMTMLLGSSIAFVLHPSKEEPADSPVSRRRCQGESWQSIRKGLLQALNMQTEPQLPAGVLDSIREQWKRTFSSTSHRDTAAAAVPSVSPDSGNNTSLKCCSTASEIFMQDVGWDSWVIHPVSLTVVQCALCSSASNTLQCPPSHSSIQAASSQDQVPCCQPTSQEMVPIVYMDPSGSVVISSVPLTRSCGCGPGRVQQAGEE
ncbi:bone morphogenetic protein 7-like [Parambassis ranga]|uniref:Bone morphogenetic protein 7-like n=1 Tax=Parambassis ranga TaxID=210632 RepID=A0A6P7JBC4_9TELE|nr:bone morphogenetic protein 7-like [Parambassis ranga]